MTKTTANDMHSGLPLPILFFDRSEFWAPVQVIEPPLDSALPPNLGTDGAARLSKSAVHRRVSNKPYYAGVFGLPAVHRFEAAALPKGETPIHRTVGFEIPKKEAAPSTEKSTADAKLSTCSM